MCVPSPRIQEELMHFFDIVMILAVLLAVFVLGGQLRKVQDIGRLSKDAQHIAILTICLTGKSKIFLKLATP